VRDCWSFS